MEERQLTTELFIGGQPSADDIAELSRRGFRTVVNLRTPDEDGALADEERLVESAGLNYASIPVSPDLIDDGAVERLVQAVNSVDAAPAYVHCKSGGRAGVLALLNMAVQNGWSLQQTHEVGQKLGIAPSDTSPYRAFFDDFIKRRSPAER